MNDNSTLKIKNEIRHEHDNRRLGRCVFGVVAGILIAAGFAFAAQQHFTALEQSRLNVEMQRQRERLKSEQKRLIYEREMAASPTQLEDRARKIGLQNVSAQQLNRLSETEMKTIESGQAIQIQPRVEKLEAAFIRSRNQKAN